MRCLSCNCILSDREATCRSLMTGEFLELCGDCQTGLGIVTVENPFVSDEPPVEPDTTETLDEDSDEREDE